MTIRTAPATPEAIAAARAKLNPDAPRRKAPAKAAARPVETPVAWGPVVEASAAREVEEREPTDDAPNGEGFAKARHEAAAMAPGHVGTLLWVDARCQIAGMHALDEWWLETFRRFYESGKLVLVARVGLRGAKSVSICRALVNDALFAPCNIDKGTKGVIPVMSADRTEATDRFHTIRKILSACGVKQKKRGDEVEGDADYRAGGVGGEFTSTTLPSGGGAISLTDEQGRAVEFRIYPARLTGVVGHTDKAGLGDELDLWPVDLGVSPDEVAQRSVGGRANPADVVLDRWLERFTTTRDTAHLYLVSASYFGPDTAHARKVAEGDTAVQMVARLGEIGALRDEESRRRLAAKIGSTDPRLLAPADPMSMDVPCWATSPVATIETCYDLSRSRLGPMFGRYGGRPDEAGEGAHPESMAGVKFKREAVTWR